MRKNITARKSSNHKSSRTRGAIALEYILITALVAIALIAVFRMWGKVTGAAIADTAEDTRGALVKEP